MLLGGVLGHQQHDQQPDRFTIGGVERDAVFASQHGDEWGLEVADAAVRDGHGAAQTGGAQALARKQRVEDLLALQAVLVFEQQGGVFEQPLFAGGRDIEQDVAD